MYQRGKIQSESLVYEQKKHSGELPVIGVNTFLSKNGKHEEEEAPVELMRSSTDEKEHQIGNLTAFHSRHANSSAAALEHLQAELVDLVAVGPVRRRRARLRLAQRGAVAEHEQMMAALLRRDGPALSEVLMRHIRETWDRVRTSI